MTNSSLESPSNWVSDMAGDWLKFEVATLDKPEVCQIADAADIDIDAVVGKLLRVWSWFDQQTEEGNAPSVSKKLLDRSVGVTGFCEHMKSVGWMIDEDGLISLPNFDRHNGNTAKNRALTAKRVAGHKAKGNAKGNAPIVSSALPREEKRREEDKDQKHLSPDKPDDAQKPSLKKLELTNEVMEKIMARYNAICGHSFKGAAELTAARKKNLAKCWSRKVNGKLVFQSGKFWEEYFTWCLRDPHWHGEAGKSWKASMEFVTRHDIVDRVIDEMVLEGVFENGDS